jgi:O-antigen ligase
LAAYIVQNYTISFIFQAITALILFIVMFFYPRAGLMLLFFVIPFENMVSFPISKSIGLVLLISWLARKVITKEKIRFSFEYPTVRYLIGFMVVLIISLFLSIDKERSLQHFQIVILLTAVYLLLVDLVHSPKHLRKLGWVIGLSGGLASLVGLVQYYVFNTGILAASQSEGVRIGLSSNPNWHAIKLVVSICFLLYCFKIIRNLFLRIFIMILVGCATVSVVFTLSRGGILALGVAIAIYGVIYGQRLKGLRFTAILYPLIIGLTLIFCLKFLPDFVYDRVVNVTFHEKDLSREHRTRNWEFVVDSLLEQPHRLITGVGLNNFTEISLRHRAAHNTFFQILVETGLLGFAFYILLIYRSYRRIWSFITLKEVELQLFCLAALSAFTAILVQSLFHDIPFLKYLWLFFALEPIIYNIKRKGYAAT